MIKTTALGQKLHLVTKPPARRPGKGLQPKKPPFKGSWCKCANCGVRFELSDAQRCQIRKGEEASFFTCSAKCQLAHTQTLYNAKIGRDNAHKISAWRLKHWEGVSTHYRKVNGRHEHRVVAEQKYGRKLTFDDVVHHIDGNKRNNHPDNLEVLTRKEHCRVHNFGYGRKNGS